MVTRLLSIFIPGLLFYAVLQGPEKLHVGDPLPNTLFTRPDGQILSSRQLQGRVAVLDFWASWCAPCRAADDALDQTARHFGARLKVVSADVLDPTCDIEKFAAKDRTGRSFVKGGEGLLDRLSSGVIPTFVVIDRHQKIRSVVVGLANGDRSALTRRLREAVEQALLQER